MSKLKSIHVIGGGLAGSEAAWQITRRGIPVILHEMRPNRGTDAHLTESLAELVCSNSFRSDDAEQNAVGLLHQELRRCDSLILSAGDASKVPAGGALAVDRDQFSDHVTTALKNDPLVTIERGEVTTFPPEEWGPTIIATGPLTSPTLATAITELTGEDALSFFDAIAPIIHKDSINLDKAWYQSRYDKGDGSDYINCALNQSEYEAFLDALLAADKIAFHEWETSTPYFEGCLPVEVMAARGVETLRYGPMKPVGLTNPHNPEKPHAVVQLRQDNALGTLYNIVGFQTKMRHGEQIDVLRMIPGLENAEFARLGGLHRNTFLNSPKVLDPQLRLRACPRVRFAGQITGVEGYVESAAMGMIAGRFTAAEALSELMTSPPETTALGALLRHITGGADAKMFQPMNVNFGLFPPPPAPEVVKGGKLRKLRGRDRKLAYTSRASADLGVWLNNDNAPTARS
jgi:methylenetetrahydrofolate--tRNA-(uracil-5-)-methyltransferase